MRDHQAAFEATGARLAAIGLGDRRYAQLFREETGLTFPLLVDEERQAYRTAQLRRGNLLHILRADNAAARRRARDAGHRQHRPGRNPFQLGGSFVFGPGHIVLFAHTSRTFGDNASPDALLAAVRAEGGQPAEPTAPACGSMTCHHGHDGHDACSRAVRPMLIVLSGLPGTGKTTIARGLVPELAAVHVRIDTIEQSMRGAGWTVEGQGYRVAYAVAEDNLRVGRTVVADCVNPWRLTRGEWRAVARRVGVAAVDVEIVCSNVDEHRRRVETRVADIPGQTLPTWGEIMNRDYRAWDSERIVIDTARLTADESVLTILAEIRSRR